ncbi:MAG: SDR family oxidoreductase [Cyanobacteria bacterium MAG STY4_bin_9]|uniref:SDR family oxidoreductase n=1 Tax=Synechococcus sp. RS9902 TaxID=221345 RepID=UPI0001485674|nr:SDR family oxidoreductase [Synechococcus sp. RS9902]MDD9804043.1 SDR family oxidoreductase [Cyanobacteria bacterium MAG STY1_bin_7]MDD9882014.1 SDR family oxidoreductase [Cyanobacteria bacterium MAG STY4_bin_9]QNI98231.1 beta-ketoacyl-(acyl-carrier-protein) reductase protein family [Synechococcus sp. RS9902]HCO75428.1 short-chain dehydrogenase [Synechococcus sp. UBA8071]
MPTALITGASRGIGRRTAELLAHQGWDLLLTARSADQLEQLSAQLSTKGVSVASAAIDLTQPDGIAAAMAGLLQQGETPSVLINNAGAAYTGDLLAMPIERWQWLLQLNVTSVMQVCSAVVPAMRENGGLVINISSHAARNAFPQWGAYCVSKAALASFTRCLAEEERSNGIRACTLTLGAVNTPLWDAETVQSDFDRRAMLSVDQAAETLANLALQPSNQLIEDLTLMPAAGAF